MYFGGTNSIEVTGFYINSSYSFGMWARPTSGDGSLMSYEYTMWEGWDEYEREQTTTDKFHKFFEVARFNTLYLSACNIFKLKSDQAPANDDPAVRDKPLEFSSSSWNYFGIVETSDFNGSSKRLMLNQDTGAMIESTVVLTGPPNGKLFIGSFEGLVKFFKGFIWSFDYYTVAISGPQTGLCSGCGVCPTGGCISICEEHQYVGRSGECLDCNRTCTNGCVDASVCPQQSECHTNCKTCNGPENG
jgi:hypothetical protein